jgi:hypothetical protein
MYVYQSANDSLQIALPIVTQHCVAGKGKAVPMLNFGQPTYKKVNELFLDNPLHVILNNSKLAYRIYVILIANKELIKKCLINQALHHENMEECSYSSTFLISALHGV